jgi:TM2 domain-containing membrane protein YozV
VPASNEPPATETPVELKDPYVAGFLAWLIPGLGHFYQGRSAKGALFAICIAGTFLYGLYLSSSRELGWGRAVYFNFDDKEWRLPWVCQIGVGFPTVPMSLLQLKYRDNPLLHGFMAPPAPDRDLPTNPSLATIQRQLPHYFEFGTVYTMIAGLLNILAVYDASCGPVIPAEDEEKDEDDEPAAIEQKGDGQRRGEAKK